MNAAEQATSIEFASKIATVVRLFKSEFPALRVDLKPWTNDDDTRALVDPDSVDIGFHFPGVSRPFQCRSLLVQIRFYSDPETHAKRVIGMEVGGFDHRGKQWAFSTIHQWTFAGSTEPEQVAGDRLKNCCRQIFDVFNGPMQESA
ncbi:hypothetical protein PN498_23510 [Oscillatoria sp. CS-180]|uniref:hypothetical protein n=1 Tax=Oscillatoria sp. CS-180 TaxID=3021720 RepID=UPI00232B8F82|nr:hypothetical protein [Oscillatoria sp. CS-180]MDB9528980.1 hypothetical protein [Oscillatoria sp. CS-180]